MSSCTPQIKPLVEGQPIQWAVIESEFRLAPEIEYGCPYCQKATKSDSTGMGWTSIPQIRNMLRRIQQLGKPTVIFYISDFDPAGTGMPVHVARYVEFWLHDLAPNADIKLTPLVLTKEQV
jgi:hypothetical protein